MSEMVGRVARAMVRRHYPGMNDKDFDAFFSERAESDAQSRCAQAIHDARSAIETMREPTEAMTAAGLSSETFRGEFGNITDEIAAELYCGMIDEALR